MPTGRNWLRVKEAAIYAGVGVAQIRQWINAGELKHIDARKPGSRRPNWKIHPDHIDELYEYLNEINETMSA